MPTFGLFEADSGAGSEMGSPPEEDEGVSEDANAAQTRPDRSSAIDVTSDFAESYTVETRPVLSRRSSNPDPEVPAQTRPCRSTKSERTWASVVACTRSPLPAADTR